jgi:(p)ppGpp synthase/HD superfamily hydrolase
VQWLHSLLAQHERSVNHIEFIESLRRQVYDAKLVVFGAEGQQMRLPQGALVRDLVEQLVEIGSDTYVVQINGVIRPLDYPLQDGDSVELMSGS